MQLLDSFKIANGRYVLVCDMFDDDAITSKLSVGSDEYSKENFEICKAKKCFSEPTTRNIVIKANALSKDIQNIEFI